MKKTVIFSVIGLLFLMMGCTKIADSYEEVYETNMQDVDEKESPVKLELTLGKGAVINDELQVTVKSVVVTKYYSYFSEILNEKRGEFASKGKKFVIFEVEFKNVGKDTVYLTSSSFSLVDSEGNIYETSYQSGALVFERLLPGTKKTGNVIFEIPETVEDTFLYYEVSSIFGTKLVKWNYNMKDYIFQENPSAEISIGNVGFSSNEIMGYWSGSMYSIEYVINNTGNVGIIPLISYAILFDSTVIENKSNVEVILLKSVLPEDESLTGELLLYKTLEFRGDYTIVLNLTDKRTGKLLATTEKEVEII